CTRPGRQPGTGRAGSWRYSWKLLWGVRRTSRRRGQICTGPRQRRANAGAWAGVAFSYGAAKRERPGAQRVPGRSGPATARGRRGRSVDVEEAPQLLRAARMAQLAQRLGLDLADRSEERRVGT